MIDNNYSEIIKYLAKELLSIMCPAVDNDRDFLELAWGHEGFVDQFITGTEQSNLNEQQKDLLREILNAR